MAEQNELMTQAEYARYRGVSKARVTQWLNKGTITKTGNGIDPRKADAELTQNLSQTEHYKGKNDRGDMPVDLMKARTMREAYNAQIAKLEYEEKSGQLVARKNVENEAFSAGHAVRERVMMIPLQLCVELAKETDSVVIQDLLENKLTDALELLTDDYAEEDEPVAVAG